MGRVKEAAEAVRLLSDEGADVAPLLRSIVNGDLLVKPAARIPELDNSIANRGKMFAAIGALKRRVRRFPRNAIAWMDLALAQTVLGQGEKAREAVRVALALAPENRFVLRSAARFFVHLGDLEQGLQVLRRSKLVRADPWVMSAELSLSGVAGRDPESFKRARAFAEANNVGPWHTSELHGSLGTLELESGGGGRARKHFNRSLRQPTENAVAQAQWAEIEHRAVNVPDQLPNEIQSFEAIALKAREERAWPELLRACREWSAMEPTSSRPLVLGGFVAEVALGNGDIAAEFTERLLVTSPTDFMAMNNHAVALAYRGDLLGARRILDRINRKSLSGTDRIVNIATEGLLAYREGKRDEGMRMYLEAATEAESLKAREMQALALWHLLREEARYEGNDLSDIVEKLWRKSSGLELPELVSLKESIELEITSTVKRRASQHNLELALPRTLEQRFGHYLRAPDKD